MQMPNPRKIALIGLIALLVVLFFVFNLDQYLSLSYLKKSRETFQTLYSQYTFAVLGGFFLFYIGVVALNLPGAAIMTLAAGALFGFWKGLVLVSFASTIGATLACAVARYLFRDWVQDRFSGRFKAINRGIQREGSFYLFTLRLIPVVPFFAINLAMGLTPMRLATFYWVSQVGMLPGTAVYINAGKELGEINSMGGILSPGVIFSFVILGLFPLVVKKLVNYYRIKTGRARIEAEAVHNPDQEG